MRVDVEVDWNDADAFEAVSVNAEAAASSGEEDVLDAEFAEADDGRSGRRHACAGGRGRH